QAKKTAAAAYDRARERADAATILAGIERYAAYVEQTDVKVKYMQGWLNADRWTDENAVQPYRNGFNRPTTAENVAAAKEGAVDHRVEPVVRNDDPRIGLFHKVLGPYPYQQAEEAIVEYASEPHNVVMQVGNVVEGIKRIRGRNLDRVSRAELIPPDELEPGQ